jgi:hypothetical protein
LGVSRGAIAEPDREERGDGGGGAGVGRGERLSSLITATMHAIDPVGERLQKRP